MAGPGGKPSSLTPEVLAEAIKFAAAGARDRTIANLIKVVPGTIGNWMRWGDPEWEPKEGEHVPPDRTIYLQYFEEINAARARPTMICEASWLKAVQDGDWRAAKEWLKIHDPDLYREQIDVGLTGSLGDAATKMMESIEKMIEGAKQ